jgi:NADPH2:quinone reductase
VQGGTAATLDAGRVLRRRLTITGSTLRARSVEFKSAIARELRSKVWGWFTSGIVKPVVFRVFPAEQAGVAHALMESNVHVGKLVLSW